MREQAAGERQRPIAKGRAMAYNATVAGAECGEVTGS